MRSCHSRVSTVVDPSARVESVPFSVWVPLAPATVWLGPPSTLYVQLPDPSALALSATSLVVSVAPSTGFVFCVGVGRADLSLTGKLVLDVVFLLARDRGEVTFEPEV